MCESFEEKIVLEVCEKIESLFPKCQDNFSFDLFHDVDYEISRLYQNYGLKKENVKYLLQKIGISLYNNSIEKKSVIILLIALRILKFDENNRNVVDSSLVDFELKNKITTTLKRLKIKRELGTYSSYNDKKALEYWKNAGKNNDYKSALSIVDSFCDYLDSTDEYIKPLIRFAWTLDPEFMIQLLNENLGFDYKNLILKCASFENFSLIFSRVQDNFSVLYAIKLFFEVLEKKYNENENISEILNYADVLENLFKNALIPLKENIDVLRIHYKSSFCYVFASLLVKSPQWMDLYLKYEFYSEDSAKAFSKGFVENGSDSDECLEVLEKILQHYFEKHVKSFSRLNEYTGYIDLFIFYYSIKLNSKTVLLQKLHACSDKIQEIQNSWNFDSLTKEWFDLFYSCCGNIANQYSFSEDELRSMVPVLFDQRNELRYGLNCIEFMKEALLNPAGEHKLDMFMVNGPQTISFSKRTK